MDKLLKIIVDKQIISIIKEIAYFDCCKIYYRECPIQSICDIKLLIQNLKLNFLEVK